MQRGSSKSTVAVDLSAAQTAQAMSDVLFQFGQITRATKMPNGDYETDSHHSFALAVTAYELAKAYAPDLDAFKVMAYGLVHDLPEVITGDMPTLLSSSEELVRKKAQDRAALVSLKKTFGVAPHTLALIEAYEACADEEAKFVYWLDKAMTILTHFFDAGQNLHDLGVRSRADIEAWYVKLHKKLAMYADQPHQTAVAVLEELYTKMHDELFPEQSEVNTV